MTQGWALSVALCVLLVSLSAEAGTETSLDWGKTFHLAESPENQHFVGQWVDGKNQVHRIEVWRIGERLLRRDTDERMSIFAKQTRSAAVESPAVRYDVVDHGRKLFYEVDRANLNRLGIFYEWNQLAHEISPPRGQYTLSKAEVEDSVIAGNSCVWYELTQASTWARLCWSAKLSLPFAEKSRMGDGAWKDDWTIQSVDENVRAQDVTFTQGDYVRFDANEELSPGSD